MHLQVHLRTLTPFTQTVLQATTGFLTTTAPRGPAQPARTTPSAQTTALAVRDSIVMVAEKASRAAPASSNERILFSSNGCCCRQCSADENLLLLCFRQHLLAARRQLVALLGEAGDYPSAAGHGALAEFLVVAHAGVALGGGQLLRHRAGGEKQGAGSKQQGSRRDGDAQHWSFPFLIPKTPHKAGLAPACLPAGDT